MDMNPVNTPIMDSDIPLALGACTLVIAGAILIYSSLHERRELLGERVELLTRSSAGGTATAEAVKASAGAQLATSPGATPVEREVIRRLARFGISAAHAPMAFAGIRLITLMAFSVLVFLLSPRLGLAAASAVLPFLVAGVAGVFAWFLPKLIIQDILKSRAESIAAGLPDALDLLVICAEAGLALEDGIERVAVELHLSQPALADELMLTAADLKVLPSSEAALSKFAERVDLPPIRSLVTTLSQTMRYGTPLAQAMRVVAAGMRNDALLRLEERANKLPALMTVPMIVFIMPTIFLILGGPAALRIIDLFTK